MRDKIFEPGLLLNYIDNFRIFGITCQPQTLAGPSRSQKTPILPSIIKRETNK